MAAVGAIAAIAGSVFGFMGQKKQAKAAEKAEKARKAQMQVEAARARREALRKQNVLRGQALATASNQGAQFSSALAGAQAQITGAAARESNAISSNEATGSRLFAYNKEYAAGSDLISLGQGIASIGGSLADAIPALSRQFNFSGAMA